MENVKSNDLQVQLVHLEQELAVVQSNSNINRVCELRYQIKQVKEKLRNMQWSRPRN